MYSGCSSKELEERVIQFRSTCYDCWKLSIDEGRDVVKIAREVGKLFVGLNGKARETWIAPELRDMTRTSEVQSPQDLPSLENSLSTTFANTYLFSPDQAKLQAVGTALKSTVFFEGKGCGLVVSKDWHVLTCAHLFEEGKETSSPSVYLLDGDEKIPLGNFEVLEIDKELDMALVQFKPGVHPVPIEFVEAADVNLGFDVIVVGAPGIVTSVMTTHHWEYAVSYGKVSAPRQSRDLVEVEDRSWMPSCSMIEISTYCNGGNSGGPAVNRYGELVGLVFGSDIENCLTWAVPVDVINQFLSKHI